MKILKVCLAAGLVFSLAWPLAALAGGAKIIVGTVTRLTPSGIVFTNSTAATYTAELGGASLIRKNGSPMKFSEILVGDKVQVSGSLWNDNSISASVFKDLSLYAHNSSFTGKITNIDPPTSSFTMQSTAHGVQTVTTDVYTSFSAMGITSGFNYLQLGMTVTVKGVWERDPINIRASSVKGTIRLISIDFTGELIGKNGDALTVIGNGNVIYGVDVTSAVLQSKSGKPLAVSALNGGDMVHVWGKHVSGGVQVFATKVKDLTLK